MAEICAQYNVVTGNISGSMMYALAVRLFVTCILTWLSTHVPSSLVSPPSEVSIQSCWKRTLTEAALPFNILISFHTGTHSSFSAFRSWCRLIRTRCQLAVCCARKESTSWVACTNQQRHMCCTLCIDQVDQVWAIACYTSQSTQFPHRCATPFSAV